MKPSLFSALATATALVLCCSVAPAQEASSTDVPLVAAKLQTQATASKEANAAILVRDSRNPGRSHIVATAALGGLEVYDLAGKRVGTTPSGEVAAVDVAYDVRFGNGKATVLAAIDTTTNSLRLFSMKGSRLQEIGARPLPLGFAAEGICLFRNPLDNALYTFVVGDGGEIDQQILFPTAGGKLDARQVRRINVPSTLKQCAADNKGHVFASEEGVGIWRFNADPEADVSARIVDAPRLGHIEEESGGVAVYEGGDRRWLIASDISAGQVNVYDRDKKGAFLGAFKVAAPGSSEAIGEPGPLFATGATYPSFPHGLLLVTDEDGSNYKALAIEDIAQALKLPLSAPKTAGASTKSKVAAVVATVETTPAGSYGDAADDPAIWADPADPSKSLIVATDKKAGLYLYDMQGKVLQFLPDGKMNNVDLREGFELGGEKIVLVAASNRTDKSIGLYRLDTQKRELVNVADGVQPTGLDDPYGVCMYRSPKDQRFYVFVNGDDTRKRQWELVATPRGVTTRLVRDMNFDTQTEGCVADDRDGTLYVDEEDVALWRMSAEADGGDAKTAVQKIADNPAVKNDFEGLGIYDLGDGRGYIVVSSQGNDTYAVYRREGKQEYLGSFAVVADPLRGIDGISETDGLEVTSRNLGPGFEHGAMIAQDGRNVMPVENQNYKYVPWESIARALKLEMRGE
ncbi:phytase [Pseudoxanthomonas sacheonensis]|uniref:phytase n=1 Tax=Pseudoxanthomonas sacheonensis TaxID=443615 RepID=UPI0013D08843|nr:phytase [Pseudoxanthomonas sacheonensis]KAF1708715.1 3-phytase [Pseudoxanthomonas sacheonensis]